MRRVTADWQEGIVLTSQTNRRGYARQDDEDYPTARMRVRSLALGLFFVLAVIASRLFYLQVLTGGQHVLLSQNNHIEKNIEYAPRGIIRDSQGIELVKNREEMGNKGREYPLASASAHLLGYVSEANPEEIGCSEGICRYLGSYVGRSGVESAMENTLKGRDGGKLVELDVGGQEVRALGKNDSERGQDVTLSVDSRLQKIMQDELGDRMGSAVAIDMQGKVLGLYSSPSYDPNLFTVRPNSELLRSLLSDRSKQYFLNRAISGSYAPGSVFKLVTAYAALETGKIDRETLIEDTGEIRIDQYRFGNWYYDQYGRKEGELDVERALARSNDVFFYKIGEMTGVDELTKWAKKFGLGEKTGIELSGESVGLVPTRLWRERMTGEKWYLGNTYHLSIGQGDLLATPLQIARMTLGAVSGRLCQVSVLLSTPARCEDIGLKQENVEIVRAGMKGVCSAGGTAFPFFEFAPYVLCKTGTAEHAGQKSESDLPHAWITVAYPGENPEMILVVMLEAAGEGSYEAGPVAKEILSRWQNGRN